MVNKDPMKNALNHFYKARLSNSVEQTMCCFAKDAVFNMSGETDEAYSAEGASQGSLKTQVEALVAAWEWQEVSQQSMVIDGNQATTMYQLLTVFTPTGEQIRTQLCDHITVNDDGLIVEMTEFVDTALVQRLVAAASHREKQPSEYYP